MTRRHFFAIFSVIPFLFAGCSTVPRDPNAPIDFAGATQYLEDIDSRLKSYAIEAPEIAPQVNEIRRHLGVALVAFRAADVGAEGKLAALFDVARLVIAEVKDDRHRIVARLLLDEVEYRMQQRYGVNVEGA